MKTHAVASRLPMQAVEIDVTEVKRQTSAPRGIQQDALWCGLVFALAVLFTALNALPPAEVHYRVSSEVVTSPSRLTQLQNQAELDLQNAANGIKSSVQLLKVSVLDQSPDEEEATDKGAELVLVQIESIWDSKCTEQRHKAWLESISRVTLNTSDGSNAARENRMACWELHAARHYAARHEFLIESSDVPEQTRRIFQLATHTTQVSGNSDPSPLDTGFPGNETSSQRLLESQVELAANSAKQTELAWRQQIEQSSGLMEIASLPEIEAHSNTIPVWMVASMFVLGLASGGVANWFQRRINKGGVYDPRIVAKQLEQQGIPVVGRIVVPSPEFSDADWLAAGKSAVDRAARFLARNLTVFSEWVLGLWILFIVIRLLIDPMWRSILVDSPLAAFARLVVGLP